jgi:DNA topoisomerase II
MEHHQYQPRETEKTWAEEDWKTFILREPDTFLGSGALANDIERVLDPVTGNIVQEEVYSSQACKHTFTEALSNAQDSLMRAKDEGLPAEGIHVKFINQRVISILNIGADIISVIKNERGVWIPETVLGNLLSGSNSKAKNKTWIGKNGVGGTLVNIFSKHFKVQIWDHVRNLYYEQSWENNCVKVGEDPIIVPGGKENLEEHALIKDGCGAVKVTFELDFAKFGFEEDHYNDSIMKFYARKVLDASLVTRAPVSLFWSSVDGTTIMDTVFEIPDIESYSERFFTTKPGNFLIYKPAFPESWKPTQKEVSANVQAIVYDTPDEGYTFSFVNGQPTEMGGVHVDELCKSICQYVSSKVEDQTSGKEAVKLLPQDIMNHMTVFVYTVVPDPKFTGQTKSKLTSPRPAVRWYESDVLKVADWSMLKAIQDTIESKKKRLLSKTDGKKVRRINIDKAEDANMAGGAESHKCVLWFCEGDSAKNYALTLVENLEGGRDYNGIYPLRGKFLNVMKAKIDSIAKSKVITEIKEMMGLQEAVDYSLPTNLRQLRYGKIGILTDMDMDGNHIKYLITVLFGARFLGIIMKENMVTWLSPVIRATKGRQVLRFYSMNEFHQWKSTQIMSELKKWSIDYFKGLGGSSDEDVKDDVARPHVEVTLYDDKARDSLELAFGKDVSIRKQWINDFIRGNLDNMLPSEFINVESSLSKFLNMMETMNKKQVASTLMLQRKSITEGINNDYMHFNLLTLKRAIPSEIDGLKVSERKVLWTALKTLKDSEKIKTAQFGNIVAKETDYAHNEQILEKVISHMAQDYVFSNNLPPFIGHGQFGSQYLPKPSSGRYTHIQKNFWLRYVYREEDDDILPMVFDEGRETEPEHLIPIIPMLLINGACGIANGFSSFVPQYHPLEVSHCIRQIISGEKVEHGTLVPWFRNWKGTVELLVEDTPERLPIALQTYGSYQEVKPNALLSVTELPMGVSGDKYKTMLTQWRKNYDSMKRQKVPGEKSDSVHGTHVIKDFVNKCKKNEIHFDIVGCHDPSYQSLGLIRRFSLMNMNMLESMRRPYEDVPEKIVRGQSLEPYIPMKYETVEDYLQAFCKIRLYYYKIRKNNLLKVKKAEIASLASKHAFIKDVVDKHIDVFTWPEEKILEALSERGHSEALYSQTPIRRFSPAEVSRLESLITTEKENLQKIVKTNPQDMWIHDLDEFETVYKKHYKSDKRRSTKKVKVVKARVKLEMDDLQGLVDMRDGEEDVEGDEGAGIGL